MASPPATAAAVEPLSPELERRSRWDDRLLESEGIEVRDVPFVSVGGGLASFTLVDHLRIAGVAAEAIAVVGPEHDPVANYRRLAENSQIPDGERIRSDAGSTLDNIWGFPSYAVREAAAERSLVPIARVVGEPVVAGYYTPRAGQVYDSVHKEAKRIGWGSMHAPAWVRMVRRRRDGGYFTLVTPLGCGVDATRRVAYRSDHVHLGVGYPGVRLLDDLARFRQAYQHHSHRVVSAYEPHEHVYDELAARPSTVVVRGSGIVASRVLQRLLDDNERGVSDTRIVHLFRNYVAEPQGDRPWFRRRGAGGFAYQAFNYPKAAWGGQLRARLASLDGPARARLIDEMGGTNTAPRRAWKQQLTRAGDAGAYRQIVGSANRIRPDGTGLRIDVVGSGEPGGDGVSGDSVGVTTADTTVAASHVIDATGLIADMSEHRLLSDLLAHSGAGRNAKGRLDVDPDFVVRGTESGAGRVFASGAMTLGGYHAGADSFLGMQYAGLRIADRLAAEGWCERLGLWRSVGGWCRWMAGASVR